MENQSVSKCTLLKRKQRERLQNDPEKHDETKQKDRERKKKERLLKKSFLDAHPRFKKREQQRKTEAMRKYRQKKKEQLAAEKALEPLEKSSASKKRERRKKDKDRKINEKVLKEEQKKQTSLRVKNWRLRIKLASQEHDIENAQDFSSRQSQYRATKRVKENLPETPSKKAKIIEKLIESPRTNEILSARGITNTPVTKRKLDMYDELSKSLKNHYNEIKPKGRPTNTKFAACVLLQEIVHKTGKYGLKTELQRKLKIRHRRSSKAHSQQTESKWWAPRQKRRKDQISNEIKESVQNFFLAPDISREVPDKRAAIKIQDGAKKRLVQHHYMTLTMKDAFDIYRNLYPENKIGLLNAITIFDCDM